MCITSDGFPISFASNPDKDYVGPSNLGVATFRFLFHNVILGPQSIEEPICPECAVAPCAGEGTISMQVMRLTNGGGEPWNQIWNLDVADIPGEIMFDPGFTRTYLKVFNVTVNSSWGPARDCNFVNGVNTISPPREPSLAKLVARGDAESFDASCGQCSENAHGSYYAFPKEGECSTGVPIGTDGCTWHVNNIKVMTTECIKSAGECGSAASDPFGEGPACIRRGISECPDIRALRR